MDLPFLVGTIIAVASLIIAIATYKKSFPKISKEDIETQEEKNVLLVHFRTTQTLAKEVRDSITKYATVNCLLDADMYSGLSYAACISAMTESHKECLSDELYK